MVGTCNSHEITIIIHNGLIETWRRVLHTPPLLSGGAPQVLQKMDRNSLAMKASHCTTPKRAATPDGMPCACA